MTLLTSLFNKGIYKSTIRRFTWGSVFYFVILFMLTAMPILMSREPNANDYAKMIAYIHTDSMTHLPITVGNFVPLVVAMLIFRFVHSKKPSIFVHSLPVKRETNYVSSVLAGITLMAAPIILNGIILMIMSLSGYGYLFDAFDCVIWMGLNLLCVCTLFSYATLAAMLTGNTFAVAALYILIHTFLLLLAGGFEEIAQAFLYGYTEKSTLLDFAASINPVIWTEEMTWALSSASTKVNIAGIFAHVGAALVIYAIAMVIYKKRRMEKAEEVAPFAILNPIYKYFVTFLCTLWAFNAFVSGAIEKPTSLLLPLIIVSALAYFACEMALKKTLKVWRSYKGYLGFGAVFALILCVFCFTSFFGFETRIPKVEEIESVEIRTNNASNGAPYIEGEELKKYITEVHKETLEGDDAKDKWFAGYGKYPDIHINYKLKNGGSISRVYGIDEEKNLELMNKLYEFDEYKIKNEGIFNEELEKLAYVRINNAYTQEDIQKCRELLECVRSDVMRLKYSQIYLDRIHVTEIPLRFFWVEEIEEEALNEGYEKVYLSYAGDTKVRTRERGITINANFKNTMQWLKDNGYWDKVTWGFDEELYICNDTWDETPAKGEAEAAPVDKDMRYVPLYRISDTEDIARVKDFIYSYEIEEKFNKKHYVICMKSLGGVLDKYSRTVTDIDEDVLGSLIEILEKEEKLP